MAAVGKRADFRAVGVARRRLLRRGGAAAVASPRRRSPLLPR